MNTICIMCPLGCPIIIEEKDGRINVCGNACKRGYNYGVSEFQNPVRTVTTLAKTFNGSYVSVKTSMPVSKNSVLDLAAHVKTLTLPDDIKIGDVAEKNALGLGADIIVTGVK